MIDKEYFSPWEIVMLLMMVVQGVLCAMLVNYNLYTDITLIVMLCVYTLLVIKYEFVGYKLKKWLNIILVVALIVCQIFNLVAERYWVLAVFVIACNICAVVEIVYIRSHRSRYIWRRKFVSKLKRGIANFFIWFSMIAVTILSSMVVLSEIAPDVIASVIYEEPTNLVNEEVVLNNGVFLIKNIKYSDNYDNSYMDIYISPKSNKNSPTFFYVHGGAYVTGDKTGRGFCRYTYNVSESYFDYYIENGYNLVSINYALSPESRYPTQLNQLEEAVDYAIKNCDYINMNDVVFSGESAGGNLIGQFVNIQTNEEYAQLLGMKPVIDEKNIRAVVFTSALLDNERMDNTGNVFIDYVFNLLGRSYFGVWSLDNNEEINKTNVITYVTENFPPTYISDGNYRSFSKQAIELSNKLSELEVENVLNYYEKDVVKLGHVYEYRNTKYSIDNVNNTLKFLDGIKK